MKEPVVFVDSLEIIVKMSEIRHLMDLLAIEYHVCQVRLEDRCGYIPNLVGGNSPVMLNFLVDQVRLTQPFTMREIHGLMHDRNLGKGNGGFILVLDLLQVTIGNARGGQQIELFPNDRFSIIQVNTRGGFGIDHEYARVQGASLIAIDMTEQFEIDHELSVES